MMVQYYLGADIGGTFTDIAAVPLARGFPVRSLKVPTNKADPGAAIEQGLQRLFDEYGIGQESVVRFAHGTTVGVNALLERTGAKLGLVVTKGFRDLLNVQRLRIPGAKGWRSGRPEPLIPRDRVFEIEERLYADGSVAESLRSESVDDLMHWVNMQNLDGLVICFLHSYVNSEHEIMVKDRLCKAGTSIDLVCSHEVWPQAREYERAVVSIVNSYVRPTMVGYLDGLKQRLVNKEFVIEPQITRSNGGAMTVDDARSRTVQTLMSGPASGVLGANAFAKLSDIANFATLDVGGTSADMSIVLDGKPSISVNEHIGGFPIMTPTIGISAVGAGGGSLVTVDSGNLLRVGPKSAGADPGPACYDRGNQQATLTDAFVVLGRMPSATLAGGALVLNRDSAITAVGKVAEQLDIQTEQAAEGIVAVAVSGMYAEFSNMAAKDGIDTSSLAMVAYGGAGPMLACELANQADITTIIVPPEPGTICGTGAAYSDLVEDFTVSLGTIIEIEGDGDLHCARRALAQRANNWIGTTSMNLDWTFSWVASMRYHGQSYEIDVELDDTWLNRGGASKVIDAFNHAHEEIYRHSLIGVDIEILDLRLRVSGKSPETLNIARPVQKSIAPTRVKSNIYVHGKSHECQTISRDDLMPELRIDGPGIIVQADSTVYVAPGWQAEAQELSANLLLRKVS